MCVCVWGGGGRGVCRKEEWGQCSCVGGVVCQGEYFFKVMHMLTLLNFSSGALYTEHS